MKTTFSGVDHDGKDQLYHGKCKFFYDQLGYQGDMIIPESLEVRQIKVDSLQKILTPLVALRGCVLLGLANYNR